MACNCKKNSESFQQKVLSQSSRPIPPELLERIKNRQQQSLSTTQNQKNVQPNTINTANTAINNDNKNVLSASTMRYLAKMERINMRKWRDIKKQRLLARRQKRELEEKQKQEKNNNQNQP